MNLIIQTSLHHRVLGIGCEFSCGCDLMIVYHLHFFLNPRIWWCCFFDSSINRIRLAGKPVWCTKTWTKTWTGDMDGHLMLWWSCLDLFLGDFLLQFEPILTMTLAHDFDPTTCLTKTRALLQFCKSCYQNFGFHFCWTWSNIAFWNVG